MAGKYKNIDEYIAAAAAFAKPILIQLRETVHQVCPQADEKIKWNMPHFDYRGQMMCHMAAFKQHCAFGFWKAALMKYPELHAKAATEEAMGNLGRICRINDLPSDSKLTAYILDAMALNEEGIQVAAPKKSTVIVPETPADFKQILKTKPKAWAIFENFPPSHKKEYINWIVEAKTEPTRLRRMENALLWIVEGKSRNWKYEPKK